jgi:glycosyltransferase involved in cell wall biosynthesis
VVCFSGARDHYQAAQALADEGLLEKLVTDLYLEPGQVPFAGRLSIKFPKLLARYCPGVPKRKVLTPVKVAFSSLLMKFRMGSVHRQIRLDNELGKRARTEAWKAKAAVLSYSYYAAAAFATGSKRASVRILFQLHPHPEAVRKILSEEIQRVPKFAASLRWEHEIGAPESHFNALCTEPSLANGWIAASSYTASTMAVHGVPREQIHVVPYGVDAAQYPCRDIAPRLTEPFRIVWVGNMTQRKGLSYFLDAISALPQDNLEVVICGHHAVDLQAIHDYGLKTIRTFCGLPTRDLTSLLRSSDLFVLPSLAEGFGHVILEAMSSGLPVLTTVATCAPDVIEDGKHGFMVPIRDVASLIDRINWARLHRSELYQMGLAAAVQARLFTWEKFRRGIASAYKTTAAKHRELDSSSEPGRPTCALGVAASTPNG